MITQSLHWPPYIIRRAGRPFPGAATPLPVPLVELAVFSFPIPEVAGAGNRESGRGRADTVPMPEPYFAGARSPLTVGSLLATCSAARAGAITAGAAIGTLLGPVVLVGTTPTLPFEVIGCLSTIGTRRGPVPNLFVGGGTIGG